SMGVFTRQYFTEQEVELRARGIQKLYDLEAEGVLHLRRNGYLRPGRGEEQRRLFETSVALQRAAGVADPGRVIELAELERLLPALLFDGMDWGKWARTEGYTDGGELSVSLAAKARALGAKVLSRQGLTSVRKGASTRFLLGTAGGLEIPADIVVNCAGAWAG